MNETFKQMIDKGGDFGIICVFLLLLASIIIKGLKSKEDKPDQTIIKLFDIIKVFSIISIVSIFAIKIFHQIDTSKLVDRLIARKIDASKIKPDSPFPLAFEKTFEISKSSQVAFLKSGEVSLIKKSNNFWTGVTTYDTLFRVRLEHIRSFYIYNFEKIFCIEYKGDVPNDKFLFDENLKLPEFLPYILTLEENGIEIEIKYNSFHFLSVIGLLFFVLGIIVAFYSMNEVFKGNCAAYFAGIFWITVIFGIGFIFIFHLRFSNFHN